MNEDIKTNYHQPVMVDEVLQLLKPERGGVFVDCTLGGGRHARALLEQFKAKNSKCKIKVFGIDRDAEAIEHAKERLNKYDNVILAKDNFVNVNQILEDHKIGKVGGILVDLGVSSHQLDDAGRGFSFGRWDSSASPQNDNNNCQNDIPLDMRMDREQDISAYDVINYYSERELERIIREYGEERRFRQIAREIVIARKKKKIETTGELVDIIAGIMPGKLKHGRKHFATNVFRAIRIEVNDELDAISTALPIMINKLARGGVLIVISFHSLEDRIVKNMFKSFALEYPARYQILTKKPLVPSDAEVESNRRARSAKLRAITRMDGEL
ncbi:16S rRNA (cytosine(1402)-N(4))-methyltransferase [Candidatus Berkelbacteria bacterium RIFOXYA2_FULL_43_10]|uniref:Ribosomal RNA small subunit methyltransferase H n=1 Tax=Candidatus Berkelbacteria bacterium RIFOXYA2_FULL_43_10 TaxID=1797472 RepID=A0A1F5E992_9BACT|nr:MAG: 16S rRNA (cytosine(1402)-N(4))-methyltransferase [Candidatus Berkelbacteria bacterium RIFOXYA2_FULL_43_10]